ncbi:CotY/CotZ family spore coat protein [Neobacillus sp. SM06]|uniref:CotY/CotZ family spore coat protein n=1 Tax=Neobacillus sp. SM06 TaxID=3422492 RepID=UPI003D2BFE09
MVCGNTGSTGENCVCSVLRAIVDAQDQVSPTSGCTVSCEKSIQELLNGVSPASTSPNTIPVILYCDCNPFLGTGVRVRTTGGAQHLECIQSFVFRVNDVDDNCCASLELLEVKGGPNPANPCKQFEGAKPEDIKTTGICITVDLCCFCAVTCLEPVTLAL